MVFGTASQGGAPVVDALHPATHIREQRNPARNDGELTGLLSGVLPTSGHV
jgi:hypothetical protein